MLRLGIDEYEEDDLEGEAAGLPFVIEQDCAAQYGTRFSIFLDKNQVPVVTALR